MTGLDHVRGQMADIVRPNVGQFGLRWIAELDLSDRRGYRVRRFVSLDFHGRPVAPRIGHGVAPITVSVAFDELRSTASANSIECTACRVIDFQHVHPIDLFSRDVVGSGALGNLDDRRVTMNLGANGVVIVFANKQQR
jgi:hypothetical protein